MLRHITAAVVVARVLAGCSAGQDAAPESTSTTTSSETSTSAAAAEADEQQIRDLVAAQSEAFAAGDWDALAELTCAQYREQTRNPGQYLVPPIGTFGSREQLATLSVPQASDLFAEQFGSGVSKATVDRVAQAIVDYDVPAYEAAMLDVVTESTSVTIDKVDTIVISGDTATADITSTRIMGETRRRPALNPPLMSVRTGSGWTAPIRRETLILTSAVRSRSRL